ncbi:bifunctional lysylphosphatidylglycerol flippase/synthetase MprF [Halomonas sp. HP20-15]|uniref:bifunctional lysylphosphatidylglycerol flippase/synthetase MprF n=1 Tax=Halomonas sp. HP20-15 TaxID=3085901 RepID=UPI0029818950|nr:bifunctional lysylphosphatidylglycerol flippase/synthetase MprF [Halomonas sp. HP20-15]MDW5375835.1 bifunctional lysylphosphatidylglycerol flippase/synthetase MprF [Halomonas sp. HP20-15]
MPDPVTSTDPEGSLEQRRGHANRLLLWLRRLVPPMLLLVVLVLVGLEVQGLNFYQLRRTTENLELWKLVLVVLAGLMAVIAMTGYDLAVARGLRLNLSVRYIFRYAWVANTFNNIAGVSGLTGSGIRFLALNRAEIDNATITRYVGLTALSTPLGLAGLAIAGLPSIHHLLEQTTLPSWLGYALVALATLYLLGYLCFERFLPLPGLDARSASIGLKMVLLVISALEWTAAAGVFWLCLWLVGVTLPPWILMAAFAFSATLGVLSFLPGGLGVLDGTLILLLTAQGVPAEAVLTAVLLFRVCYYLVPWLLGVEWGAQLFVLQEPRALRLLAGRLRHIPLFGVLQIPVEWLSTLGVRMLAWVTLSAGIVLLLSNLLPVLGDRAGLIRELVPLFARETSHLATAMIGTLLIGLSRGIAAQTIQAYRLTQWLLLLGMVLSLLKGLSLETALYLGAVSLLLWTRRSDFRRTTFPLVSRQTLGWLVVLMAAVGGYLVFGGIIYGDGPVIDMLSRFGYALDRPRFVRAGLVVFTTALALVAWVAFTRTGPRLKRPTQEDLARAREVMARHGGTPFAHLALLGDKHLMYDDAGESFVQFGLIGDCMIALGDPVGAPNRLREAIAVFRAFADRNGCTPVFYEIDEDHLHLYHDLGFAIFKLGEQAIVDLHTFSVQGRQGRDFRLAINHAEREGLSFELIEPPLSDEVWEELKRVSDDWLGGRNEKGFSLGTMNRDYLNWAPIAVVRQAQRIVAFANLMPAYGPIREMSLDLMRYRSDAPKSTMDFLFVKLLLHAQATGHETFNLGMAPLSGVGEHPYARFAERGMRIAYEHGNVLYNYKGLRAYKEKFRPHWRSAYLVYPYTSSLRRVLLDSAALVAGGYLRLLRRG